MPEGLRLPFGRLSGLIYVFGMDALRAADGFMNATMPSCLVLAAKLKDSNMIKPRCGR